MPVFSRKVFGYSSAAKYFQGPGIFNDLGKLSSKLGKNVFVIIDTFFFEEFTEKLKVQFATLEGCEMRTCRFGGQASEREIARCRTLAGDSEVIVGIGGGKTIDTAKAVANELGKPVVIMPTTASTDAPTSAVSIIYTEDDQYDHVNWYRNNPNVILVDSDIITAAPPRFLAAGFGDALATYYEARAYMDTNSEHPDVLADGMVRMTATGMAIAKQCRDTLFEKAGQALSAVRTGVRTQAVEDVIEANILMSGLGYENTGCSCAHFIANGITALPAGSSIMHGEAVAFGLICQLVLENRPAEELDKVIKFCFDTGLPICLADMGLDDSAESAKRISDASRDSYWDSVPAVIDDMAVYNAICAANELVKEKRYMRNGDYYVLQDTRTGINY